MEAKGKKLPVPWFHQGSATADVVNHQLNFIIVSARTLRLPRSDLKHFLQDGKSPLLLQGGILVLNVLGHHRTERAPHHFTITGNITDCPASQSSSVILDQCSKIADTPLLAGSPHGLHELHVAAAHHHFGVCTLGDCLNKIAVCVPGKVEDISYSYIPG